MLYGTSSTNKSLQCLHCAESHSDTVIDCLKVTEPTVLCIHWKKNMWALLHEHHHIFKSCGCHYTSYTLKSQVDTKLSRMLDFFLKQRAIKR